MLRKLRHRIGFWLLKDLPPSTFRIYGLERHKDDDVTYEFIDFHKFIEVEFDYPEWVHEKEGIND